MNAIRDAVCKDVPITDGQGHVLGAHIVSAKYTYTLFVDVKTLLFELIKVRLTIPILHISSFNRHLKMPQGILLSLNTSVVNGR